MSLSENELKSGETAAEAIVAQILEDPDDLQLMASYFLKLAAEVRAWRKSFKTNDPQEAAKRTIGSV